MPTLHIPPADAATRRECLAGVTAAGLLTACAAPAATTRTFVPDQGTTEVPVDPGADRHDQPVEDVAGDRRGGAGGNPREIKNSSSSECTTGPAVAKNPSHSSSSSAIRTWLGSSKTAPESGADTSHDQPLGLRVITHLRARC